MSNAGEMCKHGMRVESCVNCQPIRTRQSVRAVSIGRERDELPSPNLEPEPSGRKSQFKRGDEVRVKANPAREGRIDSLPIRSPGGFDYKVFFSATDKPTLNEHELEGVSNEPHLEYLPHREFLRDLILLKASNPLSDTLYSLGASRIEYYPYQFKPVLKFLKAPEQRLLIADEVGLGKTIEAALVYRELSARRDMKRVLIICPAGLREKWRRELLSRFDEKFEILDTSACRQFLNDHRTLGEGARLRGICSLEMMRMAEFRDRLAEQAVEFDLVIIDEAHHLRNPTTQSFELGRIVTEQSHALVLLSATPLQTGNRDLFTLMQLINPGDFARLEDFQDRLHPNEFLNQASRLASLGKFAEALKELKGVENTSFGRIYPRNPRYRRVLEVLGQESAPTNHEIVRVERDLLELHTLARVLNRTRKRDVHENTAERSPFTIEVELSTEERTFYDAVEAFVRWQHNKQTGIENAPVFAVITRERQAASCIQVLKTQFQESLKSTTVEMSIEISDPDISEEDTATRQLSELELGQLPRLLSLCRNLGEQDTKFERFMEALWRLLEQDPKCKVLVFSFFRGTVQYLYDRLTKEGFVVETIHGKIPSVERQRRIDEFRERDDLRIMVSTEVGAEGLDFEFCGALFNYDLPWNPMRVEQRIGRIDRFGQEYKRIRIYNLVIANTIETRIFERLYNRIGLFESSIGDLEPILGEVIRDLSREIFKARLTAEEERRKVEEAERILERYRLEQEAFEKERGLFLGQDALLQIEMEDIQSSGRYVSAEEVHALVDSFVEKAFANAQLRPDSEGDRSYSLYRDPNLIKYVRECTRQGNQATDIQFTRRLESEPLVPLTFDKDIARQRRHIEFVTLHHPLALAALAYFRKSESRAAPKTKIWIENNLEMPRGDYAFFIYRFDIFSVSPQCILVPILISINDPNSLPFQSEVFLKELTRERNDNPPEVTCDEGCIAELESSSDRYAAELRYSFEESEGQNNDALVDERIAGLERHFSTLISNAKVQLESVSEERIKRMRNSEIVNLTRSRDERIGLEESKRRVRVEYRMIASGLARTV